MQEIWKALPNLSRYLISNTGKIKSLVYINERLMKPIVTKKGYLRIGLWFDNKDRQTQMRIHRLVALAFIPNPLNLPEINHKDGDKSNNNDWNLEWCTGSGNMQHWANSHDFSYKHKPIYQFNSSKQLIKKHESIKAACKELGINHQRIQQSLRLDVRAAGFYFSRYDVF